jgi:hypothetical protein
MKHFKSVTKSVPARASFLGWLFDLIGLSFLGDAAKDDSSAPGNPYNDTDLGAF